LARIREYSPGHDQDEELVTKSYEARSLPHRSALNEEKPSMVQNSSKTKTDLRAGTKESLTAFRIIYIQKLVPAPPLQVITVKLLILNIITDFTCMIVLLMCSYPSNPETVQRNFEDNVRKGEQRKL
jgi:hypothetical protein